MSDERKWITEPDEYECKLLPETEEMAELELREIPKERNQALDSFREWIYQNPKILNCRLGI